jgi:hypothetical protein
MIKSQLQEKKTDPMSFVFIKQIFNGLLKKIREIREKLF